MFLRGFLFISNKMKNNTNYFSHDCNARDDEKIMMLRVKFWREWYWVWRLIVEKLSEATDYMLLLHNKELISTLYQANIDIINYLFDVWLLKEDKDRFYAPSLLKRMKLKIKAKQKMSEWGKKAMSNRRWKAQSDKVLITSKVKESKVKESKVNNKDIKLAKAKDPTDQEYWNNDINILLKKIKLFNNWICDWTQKEQRQYWKNLIWKLKKIDKIKNWEYERSDYLESLLKIISQNQYQSWKISGPKKIFYSLAELIQVANQTVKKETTNKIPTFTSL